MGRTKILIPNLESEKLAYKLSHTIIHQIRLILPRLKFLNSCLDKGVHLTEWAPVCRIRFSR